MECVFVVVGSVATVRISCEVGAVFGSAHLKWSCYCWTSIGVSRSNCVGLWHTSVSFDRAVLLVLHQLIRLSYVLPSFAHVIQVFATPAIGSRDGTR